jgi:hypothetical protein
VSTDVAQPDPDDVLGNIAAIKAVTADWVSAANETSRMARARRLNTIKEPFLQLSSRGAACLSKGIPLMHPHGLPRSSRAKSHASYSVHRTGPSIRHRRKRHERAPGASSRDSGTPPSALTMSKGQRRRV